MLTKDEKLDMHRELYLGNGEMVNSWRNYIRATEAHFGMPLADLSKMTNKEIGVYASKLISMWREK